MKKLFLGSFFALLCADVATCQIESILGNAISWHGKWQKSLEGNALPQVCTGDVYTEVAAVVCSPSNVFISFSADGKGDCPITAISLADPQTTLPTIKPNRNFPSPTTGIRTVEIPHTKTVEFSGCAKIFGNTGKVSSKVMLQGQINDPDVSLLVLRNAVQFQMGYNDSACSIKLPLVKTGDPFAHVYLVCGGVVDSVWEFPIENGKVREQPHWIYDRPHKSIPAGAAMRLKSSELWLGSFQSATGRSRNGAGGDEKARGGSSALRLGNEK